MTVFEAMCRVSANACVPLRDLVCLSAPGSVSPFLLCVPGRSGFHALVDADGTSLALPLAVPAGVLADRFAAGERTGLIGYARIVTSMIAARGRYATFGISRDKQAGPVGL